MIEDDPDAVELDDVRGEIEFRDVHFAFDDEPDRYVMQGLNLHVQPGEIVRGRKALAENRIDFVGESPIERRIPREQRPGPRQAQIGRAHV